MCKKMLVILGSVVFLFSIFGRVEAKEKQMLTFVVPPVSSLKILPNTSMMSAGVISSEIKIIACSGEYEPASFVISALSDINSLKVEATDLKGKKGVIPSENIDIKVVKCWYQAGNSWNDIKNADTTKKILTPELLLNDDSLVKVDYEKQENYLKLSFPEGEKYVWISNPDEEMKEKSYKLNPVKDYPVKDSPVLLPVNISANTNKQFWITIRVPDNAGEGVYKGKINLTSKGENLGSLTLKLKVLPFKLASPKACYDLKKNFISSIYYRGVLHQDYPKGTISSEYKSEEQLKAELKNMFAHGVINPICYQPFNNKKLFKEYLTIRNEIGMLGQTLYCCYVISLRNVPGLKDRVKEVLEFVKSYGISEAYFYGIDEASGDKLKSQRPGWEAVREAGGKMFVASCSNKRKHFEVVGDIQNLFVAFGYPLRAIADEWHSVGHKVVNYGHPHSAENPDLIRRNYGLLLWKHNYDGAMNFAYQWSVHNIWNDFDSPKKWRDGCFAYPTMDGVIDTIQWEGYREGVDDVRYATTLLKAIEEGKKSKDTRIKRVAIEAEKYLEELKNMDLADRNLDTVRLEIINHILKLTGKE